MFISSIFVHSSVVKDAIITYPTYPDQTCAVIQLMQYCKSKCATNTMFLTYGKSRGVALWSRKAAEDMETFFRLWKGTQAIIFLLHPDGWVYFITTAESARVPPHQPKPKGGIPSYENDGQFVVLSVGRTFSYFAEMFLSKGNIYSKSKVWAESQEFRPIRYTRFRGRQLSTKLLPQMNELCCAQRPSSSEVWKVWKKVEGAKLSTSHQSAGWM